MSVSCGRSVVFSVDLTIISLEINLFSPWYSWKIADLALNNNHSITTLVMSGTAECSTSAYNSHDGNMLEPIIFEMNYSWVPVLGISFQVFHWYYIGAWSVVGYQWRVWLDIPHASKVNLVITNFFWFYERTFMQIIFALCSFLLNIWRKKCCS